MPVNYLVYFYFDDDVGGDSAGGDGVAVGDGGSSSGGGIGSGDSGSGVGGSGGSRYR